MFDIMPKWMLALVLVFVLFGVWATIYTFQQCGWSTFFLGNSGFTVAWLGLCGG